MTTEILIVLGILVAAIILFISEKLRPDLVALMVLVLLALTGLVTPQEAISGFSSPAVVTVWAVLILSAALGRTGVANIIGQRLLKTTGTGEVRLIVAIMLTVGILSGFMNDIGVATLMLPVVIVLARRTGRAPSKLLMPLAFAALLGGLITLIGTPPNILISDALRQAGLEPFQMFDYAPTGIPVLVVGVAFMALVGRRLLPDRDIAKEVAGSERKKLEEVYALKERLFMLNIPPESPLGGMTLSEARFGSALGINVIGILRSGNDQLAPDPDAVLEGGDRLLVSGQHETLKEIAGRHQFLVEGDGLNFEGLISSGVELAQVALGPNSSLIGLTLRQSDFRRKFGLNVIAIWREGRLRRTRLRDLALEESDILLVQGTQGNIQLLSSNPDLFVSEVQETEIYSLGERLFSVRIPPDSDLIGKSLNDSHLADAYGLSVLGIIRDGQTKLMPDAEEALEPEDTLLVEGRFDHLLAFQGREDLEIEEQAEVNLTALETDEIGLSEVLLSPRTSLDGKTLRQIRFRDKYKMNVVAIMRTGHAIRSNVGGLPLQFGDALLLFGRRMNLNELATDPDFLVLEEGLQVPPRSEKAPIAALIMALVLVPVMLGWLPIAISAVMGVVLMVLTGCLNMEEAYRAIEWKAIFLIAGMLPLGIALQSTGAASLLAERMVNLVGGLGPTAVMAALFLLAALASQVMPNPAVAVLLSPIALNTAADLGVSPYPLMMAVAISASAAFLSPVGHSANLLIMGPGGYRFKDYTRVGVPLTMVVLVVVILVVPLVWPF